MPGRRAEAAELVAAVREAAVSDMSTKSTETDVVTAGDRAAERLIRERLAELWPGVPVIGEEEGGQAPADRPVVGGGPDRRHGQLPVRMPCYAVSVAAQVDGVSVAGAVVEPASGRMWTASRGHGARLDGRPLRVSGRVPAGTVAGGDRIRLCGAASDAAGGAVGRAVAEGPRPPPAGCRSLDLCAVAAGWVDAYVEHGLHRWDWAAGALIAEEAGAVVRLPGDDDGSARTRCSRRHPASPTPCTRPSSNAAPAGFERQSERQV